MTRVTREIWVRRAIPSPWPVSRPLRTSSRIAESSWLVPRDSWQRWALITSRVSTYRDHRYLDGSKVASAEDTNLASASVLAVQFLILSLEILSRSTLTIFRGPFTFLCRLQRRFRHLSFSSNITSPLIVKLAQRSRLAHFRRTAIFCFINYSGFIINGDCDQNSKTRSAEDTFSNEPIR